MMIPMTQVAGVPDKSTIREGMAYFPNTGPFGTTCGGCAHRGYYKEIAPRFNKQTEKWEERQRKIGACAMFRKLSGKHGPIVETDWPSCKYFEPK